MIPKKHSVGLVDIPPGIAGHLMTVAQRVAQGLKDSDDRSVPRRRFHDWGGRTKEAQWSPEHHTPGDVGPDGGRSAAGREQVAPTGQQYGGEDGHQHDADLGCRLAEQTPPPYPSAALPPGWRGGADRVGPRECDVYHPPRVVAIFLAVIRLSVRMCRGYPSLTQ